MPSNSSSYHIRENEMNCLGSSEYIIAFMSFTRARFLNMRMDQSWLIRTSFPKSTILEPFCLTIAFAKCPNMAILRHCLKFCFFIIFGFIRSYARFMITYSRIAMSAKFPCVLKRPIVPGIIDLPKFNCEDLEEIVAGGQGSFGVYW